MNKFDKPYNINKYDKPYRILPIYDEGRIKEIFNLVDKLDTQQILNYSILNTEDLILKSQMIMQISQILYLLC